MHKDASMPLVSVIIPAYNAEEFIGATIESALAQDYPAIEIIVVDDGSTDDSAKIVRRYQERHPSVQLIQQANSGVAAARNAGIKISHGEYIAPLDADDIWFEHKISEQVKALESGPTNIGLAYGWSTTIDEDGLSIGGIGANKLNGEMFANMLFTNVVGNGSAPLIRKKCFDVVGLYGLEFTQRDAIGCEDQDMYLRIAEHYGFAVVKRILMGYRVLSDSMSSDAARMGRSHDLMIERLRRRNPSFPERFLRQSRALNCFYVSNIYISQREYLLSVIEFARSTLIDPSLLVKPGYYGLIIKRFFQLASGFVRARLPNPKNKTRRSGRRAIDDERLAELETNAREFSLSWLQRLGLRRANSVATWETEGKTRRRALQAR
jgi:glycosyltransferase involved in cell wall biosynthesis